MSVKTRTDSGHVYMIGKRTARIFPTRALISLAGWTRPQNLIGPRHHRWHVRSGVLTCNSTLAENRRKISYYKMPLRATRVSIRTNNKERNHSHLFLKDLNRGEKKERETRGTKKKEKESFLLFVGRHGRLLESSRVSNRPRNRYLWWVLLLLLLFYF